MWSVRNFDMASFFQTIKRTRTHAVTGYFNAEISFRFCLTDWTIFNRWASSSIQTIKLTIQLGKRYVDFSVWIHFQFVEAVPWTRLDYDMKIVEEISKCGKECWEQQAQTIYWTIFGLKIRFKNFWFSYQTVLIFIQFQKALHGSLRQNTPKLT